MPGIKWVSQRANFGGVYQKPGQFVPVVAANIDTFFRIYDEVQVPQAQVEALKNTRTGGIVGTLTMQKYGWKIGDRVTLQSPLPRTDGSHDWTFDIVGVYDIPDQPTNAVLISASFDYFNESRLTNRDRADMPIRRTTHDVPEADDCVYRDGLARHRSTPGRLTGHRSGCDDGRRRAGIAPLDERGRHHLHRQGRAPDEVVVLGRGAASAPQSVLSRDTVLTVGDAPGVKRAPDGTPYMVATTMVNVDAIKKDGKRGSVFLVGFTPGVRLVQPNVKVIEGRWYKPAVHEVIVSDPIRKMYRGMEIGNHITLRRVEWQIVGVFGGSDSLGDSILRADAETVMSAFGRNTFQQVNV